MPDRTTKVWSPQKYQHAKDIFDAQVEAERIFSLVKASSYSAQQQSLETLTLDYANAQSKLFHLVQSFAH